MLCDPRLVSRGYGRTFLDSLPPFRRTRSLDDVRGFFAPQWGIATADVPAAPVAAAAPHDDVFPTSLF